eukprot:TRINITY_DN3671_c0_g4_i1.p2 TRINITY_DN3671_c0_g4~~TRINITY_DN3671_c0_g4_i1.p2  ORF type:complete len:140 (-),score=70.42 TRINITY_DN3671_c0_g4_i1:170-538(-)
MASTDEKLQSQVIFDAIGKRLNADLVGKVGLIYRFDIKKGSNTTTYLLDLKNGSGKLTQGAVDASVKPDATFTAKDEDFVQIASGKMSAQAAFMQKKIQIKGGLNKAMKLNVVFASAKKSKL